MFCFPNSLSWVVSLVLTEKSFFFMPTLQFCEVMAGTLCSTRCCCFIFQCPAACAWRTVDVINVSVGWVPTGKLLRRVWPGNMFAESFLSPTRREQVHAWDVLRGQLSWLARRVPARSSKVWAVLWLFSEMQRCGSGDPGIDPGREDRRTDIRKVDLASPC